METHIYDEKNGLSYTLHGDYYLPDLVLNEEEPIYGKYGMLRKQFLKEHRSARYQYLVLTGKLFSHYSIFPICRFFLIDFQIWQIIISMQCIAQSVLFIINLFLHILTTPFLCTLLYSS